MKKQKKSVGDENRQTFGLNFNPYHYTELSSVIYPELYELSKMKKGNQNEESYQYYEIPSSFDIETSSFLDYDGNKVAIMYIWQFGINGKVFIGRTWEEFEEFYEELVKLFKLSEKLRLLVYVHNLAYEFQFMQFRLKWKSVFALDTRKPVKALTEEFVEFRCSYILSNQSLDHVASELIKYKVDKKIGDLDYSLIRHSGTTLTDKEMGYCVNDVLVVIAYIQESIEHEGSISKLPLTSTGYVRSEMKKNCLQRDVDTKEKQGWKYVRYHNLMSTLTLELNELKVLMRAFQGGFTHASCMWADRVIENVGSIDYSSAYPYVMLSERFPMGKGQEYVPKDKEDFLRQLKLYCCVFDIEIFDLEASTFIEHPISYSRCYDVKNADIDNGRIIKADHIITSWTNVDFEVNSQFYTFGKYRIYNFYRYKKGYLPIDFVKTVLSYYEAKTTLKGVLGKETDYMLGKARLNALYGMSVTSVIFNEHPFDNEEGWLDTIIPNQEEKLEEYNNSKSRVLFYPWGVFVTAYNRRNLLTAIKEFDTDYIYSDTDSIKCINIKNHMDFIENYNKQVEEKLRTAMAYHKIDFDRCKPKTIKGKEKLIGVWDNEGNDDWIAYSKFKTLGSKRYVYEYAEGTDHEGEKGVTIAGLNKRAAVRYIETNNLDMFDFFNNDMTVPKEATDKNCHTYIDVPRDGIVEDYQGNKREYHELSAVHLGEAEFTLKLTDAYVKYLLGFRSEKEY